MYSVDWGFLKRNMQGRRGMMIDEDQSRQRKTDFKKSDPSEMTILSNKDTISLLDEHLTNTCKC